MPPKKNSVSRHKPKTARREMSDVEKGMIIAFFHIFEKISVVATLVNRPWSTVRNFLARACDRGHIENAPRSGRPVILNQRERRAIIRAATKDRSMTRLELRNRHAPHVSVHTIDRVLREANIKKWLAQTRPRLTAAHAKKRLDWALARKNWTAEDFEGILYSDECTIRKSANPAQIWVFRTPEEKWLADCIKPRGNTNEIGLMVWGCFWRGRRGPLVPILESKVDRWVYIALLDRHLPPVMQEIAREVGDPLFQQDNARVHTAKDTRQWFADNAIDLEDHPPLSPDLNPIEHSWVELKRRLYLQYPDILDTRGGPDRIRQRLAVVLPLVWATIPDSFFEKLWRSMPSRVAAVIDAKGWYTRY